MKRKILWSVGIALLMTTISSCLKDTGNYDYVSINEVRVTGVAAQEAYEAFAYIDTLRITPTIHGEGLDEAGRYTYEWKLMRRSGDNTADSIDHVVSRERNLELLVTLEAGEYNGYYTVTDTREGTSWGTKFTLRVRSLSDEGFMVLSDDNGQGRLDMISNLSETEYVVAYDIWNAEAYDFGAPQALFYNYNRGLPSSTMYVAEKGTYFLDKDLMTGEAQNLIWAFGVPTERVQVAGSNSTTFSYAAPREVIVTADRELYARSTTMPGSMFEFPINYINGTEEFRPSPLVGMAIPNNNINYWPYGHSVLLYDETNLQFLELKDVNEYPSVLHFANTDLFSVKTGREMVHVESTLNRYTFAVLREPDAARHYLYGMTLGGNGVNTQNYYLEIVGPEQDRINHFAVHPVLPYVFYATDDKVYQFDYSQPTVPAKVVLNYAGSQIAEMSFFPLVGWNPYLPWERNKASLLVVGRNLLNATDPDNPGVVEFYTAPSLGDPLVQQQVLDGFGKIIDIELRER